MDLSRREFVSGLAGLYMLNPVSDDDEMTVHNDYEMTASELSSPFHVAGNGWFPLKVYDVASGFVEADANYFWPVLDGAWDELQTGKPASFMNYTPDVATISPNGVDINMRFDEWGRIAGVQVDGCDQVPFKQDRDLDKSEGIYSGISLIGEGTTWLPFDADIEVLNSNPGATRYEYGLENLNVVQEAYIEDGNLNLDYTLDNESNSTVELDFLTRAKVSANNNFQNPLVFKSEENEVKTDGGLLFESKESNSSVEISMEGVEKILTGHETIENDYADEERVLLKEVTRFLQEHSPENNDDYSDLPYVDELNEVEDFLEEGIETLLGRYPTGLMKKGIQLDPDGKEHVEVEIDVGKNIGNSRDIRNTLDEKILSYVRQDGGISAAHNLSPMYYPVWPRDATFAAESIAEENSQVAENFFNNFLPEVQRGGSWLESEGSFNQCYHVDKSETGTWHTEIDQPAIIGTLMPKMVEEHGLDLSRDAWEMYGSAVSRVADSLRHGLLPYSPDYAEQPTDAFRKSLWTATYAAQALETASDPQYSHHLEGYSPDELSQKADNVKKRINELYFEPDFRTDAGLIGEELSPSSAYGRLITDTDVLTEEQEDKLLDHLNDKMDTENYWTPGLAALGSAMEQKGRYEHEVKDIKHALHESVTDHGHIPERVKHGKVEDATELTWGVAEVNNLIDEPLLNT